LCAITLDADRLEVIQFQSWAGVLSPTLSSGYVKEM
jgi:hypothetical protein